MTAGRFDPLGADRVPDQQSRGRDPRPLQAVLGEFLTRRGWSARLRASTIHARWEDLVGAQIAAHTRPVRLHGGVLVLAVDSPAWATQLRYLGPRIMAALNDDLGAGTVTRLTIQVETQP